MFFLIFSGIIALFFGMLLLVAPEKARMLNRKVSKVVTEIDELIYKYNQGIGICLLLSGATLLFVAYYISRRF